MRFLLNFLCFHALLLSAACFAEDLIVIGNPSISVDNLNVEELADFYLLKVTIWPDGKRVIPVNREAASPLRAVFSNTVLHQSPQTLVTYWNEMHFKGKMPPLIQESDEAVLAFVQKVPGAIGYINASLALQNVKILARIRP
jgi:ABC-type phosphate transport system substrate-binding protein